MLKEIEQIKTQYFDKMPIETKIDKLATTMDKLIANYDQMRTILIVRGLVQNVN